jgi:hypothetical protein
MARYSGIWPVAPTPFHETGDVDRDGMKRVLDCMIDQGVDGICILANFSEQFLISDAEREDLTRICRSNTWPAVCPSSSRRALRHRDRRGSREPGSRRNSARPW